MFKQVISLITIGFVAALMPALASDEFALPITLNEQGKMTVPVRVNGMDAPGVVDTGSTYTLVDDDLLSATEMASDRDVTILGIGGTLDYPATQIDRVDVGALNLTNVPAAINGHRRFPGHKTVLPASAFPHRTIDFDFERGQIHLYQIKPRFVGRSFQSRLQYREIDGLPFIPVTLNGQDGIALIDTGADTSIINRNFARGAKTRLREESTRLLQGTDVAFEEVTLEAARELRIGRHQIDTLSILVTDSPVFTHFGLEDEPVMVIGMNILRHFRVQIDRETKMVRFVRRYRKGERRPKHRFGEKTDYVVSTKIY